MNTEMQSARDDLAYMRALVGDTGRMQQGAGIAFMWAGLLYGFQCIVHWTQAVGLTHLSDTVMFYFVIGITVAFMGVLAWIIWNGRNAAPQGVSARALNAAYSGAGIANLVMAFVFGYSSSHDHNFQIWLFHPIVVCMFQGVAWYVAWQIRRRAWLGFVSLGWFAITITLGILRSDPPNFVLVLGIGLFVLMALPGYVMARSAKAAA
ncbi:MAG: hypothetical protein ABUL55_01205 [Pseudomonadota bacterium]